ncbi:MAG: hypothetical protein ABFS12_16910, partial [Bacteroidota bacterium]
NSSSYIIRIIGNKNPTEGILLLKAENGMLIMDVLEIAPNNIGKNKEYDFVAGCLIAFACRESFKVESNYKGYLTFTAKTNLIPWYSEKYGAELALGQKMFISPENGEKLINEYLYRKL